MNHEIQSGSNQKKLRCPWCLGFDQYIKYHDEEWGLASFNDLTHFEFLILESAQAGLSWATILKKRDAYRQAFSQFDPSVVAEYDAHQIQKLMGNKGIVRNILKIEAAVNNARRFLEIQQQYGSFSDYIWDFVDGQPIVNAWKSMQEIPSNTFKSNELAKDMKRRGFKFLGSTVLYAHMQATGLINDHLVNCFRYPELTVG
ncbi:MAG: DNA-3-methyladenine glycosylase I [Balneolales bacterium]